METKKLIFLLLLTCFCPDAYAKRIVESLNANWSFYFASDVSKQPTITNVNLPHTWNANEAVGRNIYFRGSGNYAKKHFFPKDYEGKRLFLKFEGANSVAHVFVNQKFVGKHEGGYTAFCLEITDFVRLGEENQILVQVSNAYRLDVLPLAGDFNVYGGLHRSVSLIVTEKNCITPLDYASSGVYLKQSNVSKQNADLQVISKFSLKDKTSLSVKTSIIDKEGKSIAEQVTMLKGEEMEQKFTIPSPHLWNGKKDPYLYQVKVELLDKEMVIDAISDYTGFRYFTVHPQNGFFLNGEYLDLYGVCRHEDVQGKGSALSQSDHDQDIALLNDLGANAVRLTHYPHSQYFYEQCDREGLVLWSEIPLVGPGGYTWAGYINNPDLQNHAEVVVKEMVRQQYNHPSICFWGLFNELKLDYDDPVPFANQLNQLVKKEDNSRLTTCATFLDNDSFNSVSDVIAWNRYFGWYNSEAAQMAVWADKTHLKYPAKPFAISEYGAGGGLKYYSDTLRPAVPTSRVHPEAWQTLYHEKNWEILQKRPFVWGKFVWVIADFGSSIRTEGDTVGINDKGLITYDRQTKKDAFYYYKANWNPAPMLYLAERRHTQRSYKPTTIKAYSNLTDLELFINGKSRGRGLKKDYNTFVWQNVQLEKGKNTLLIKGKSAEKEFLDTVEWNVK